MAKLSEYQKIAIIQRLACFDTPTDVVKFVKEEFNIDISRQHVQQYDPTKHAGRQLSKKWKELFNNTREAFKQDITQISISHRSVRLAKIQRMVERAEKMGNLPLAAQLLEQAAKEVGDHFTNLRKVAPVTPDGNDPYTDPSAMSDKELQQRIDELLKKTNRNES